MNTSPTRVLLVDDEQNEYLLISRLLQSVPRGCLKLDWASDFDSALGMLTRNEQDVCLIDYRLGGADGVALIHQARERGCNAPMILLTSAAAYEVDVQAMQAGAADFLEKSQLTPVLLERVIRHAIERKRAEEALRTSEERYRLISTITSDLAYCYRLEPGGKFVGEWVTEAFTRITGFTVQEMDAGGWKHLIHAEDFHLVEARFDAFWAGRSDVSEFRIITKNGETKWMRAYGRPMIDAEHGFIRVFAAARDITEQKLADEALKLSEKRFRALIERSSDGIMLIKPEGTILYSSPSTMNILGYAPEDLAGRDAFSLMDPEDIPPLKAGLHDILKTPGKTIPLEFRCQHKEDSWRWLGGSGANLLAESGVGALVINYSDITERKKFIEQLRESRESLRALSVRQQQAIEKERRRIAREIHDELGHQLSVTRMNLAWIAKRLAQMPADVQPLLQKVEATSQLIDATVRSARRLTTDLRPGVLDTLGLPAAIEWGANQFEIQTGIRCEVKLAAHPVRLDDETATALFRILQESLTNVARHARATKVKIQLKIEEGAVSLEIQDNGKGIKPGHIVDARSYGILGMRERVGALDGVIDFESAGGTRVTVSVPLKSPSANTNKAASATSVKTRRPSRFKATP